MGMTKRVNLPKDIFRPLSKCICEGQDGIIEQRLIGKKYRIKNKGEKDKEQRIKECFNIKNTDKR